MKLTTITYELDQVNIVQAPIAYTTHRGDVNPMITICDREVYPIFVAPMASVTDGTNYNTWITNKLTPVVPRSVGQHLSFEKRMEIAEKTFVSISLKEAVDDIRLYLEKNNQQKYYICVDLAHGTLAELYQACKIIKHINPNVELMTGNVCNPDAYAFYADAGIDWVRLNVGSGNVCTSAANVGVHYGMATLIDKMNENRKAYAHSHNGNAPTKLIADGGINNFDAINKALALGADAVMCGRLIAETFEACGKVTRELGMEVEPKDYQKNLNEGNDLYRDYYGMSTRRAQKETGGEGNKTSEGICRRVPVRYSVAKWIDNMESYLRSAMTYTNSQTIKEMQQNAQMVICSDHQYRK